MQERVKREALSQLASCRARAIDIPAPPFISPPQPAASISLPSWDCPNLSALEEGAFVDPLNSLFLMLHHRNS